MFSLSIILFLFVCFFPFISYPSFSLFFYLSVLLCIFSLAFALWVLFISVLHCSLWYAVGDSIRSNHCASSSTEEGLLSRQRQLGRWLQGPPQGRTSNPTNKRSLTRILAFPAARRARFGSRWASEAEDLTGANALINDFFEIALCNPVYKGITLSIFILTMLFLFPHERICLLCLWYSSSFIEWSRASHSTVINSQWY